MQPNVTGGDVRRRRTAAGRAGPHHRDRARCVVLCLCVHASDVCVRVLVCSLSLSLARSYIYIYELVMKYFLLLKHLLRPTIRMIVRIEFSAPRRVYTRTNDEEQCWRGKRHTAKPLPRRLPPPVCGEFHFYFEIVIN